VPADTPSIDSTSNSDVRPSSKMRTSVLCRIGVVVLVLAIPALGQQAGSLDLKRQPPVRVPENQNPDGGQNSDSGCESLHGPGLRGR
jgi:hypothetical protein